MREVCLYFFKMGIVGFGGPLALLAIYQKELVERRKWISPDEFAKTVALLKALPGPLATQLALDIARRRCGRAVALLAGILHIIPSFLLLVGIAWAYPKIETAAWMKFVSFGMQAAALGLIADGIFRLARPHLKLKTLWIIAPVSFASTLLAPTYEPAIILGFGFLGALLFRAGSAARSIDPLTTSLVIVMLKAGALTFGTGLALIPVLEPLVIGQQHWMTNEEFMNAIAFGQITPGPFFMTATFVGYKVLGFKGAVLATFSVFLPSFFNVLTWFPAVSSRLQPTGAMSWFIRYLVSAVIGALCAAFVMLARYPFQSANAPFEGAGLAYLGIAALAATASIRSLLPAWAIIPLAGLLAFGFSFLF